MGSLHWIGSRRGIEATLVPRAGFSLTLLPGRGIVRRVSLQSLAAAGGLAAAAVAAFVIVAWRRPRVIVALGGYAAVPCALAAAIWRVPVVVMEQNAVPGAANRLISRFARACALSFEGTALPRGVVTGNPVRSEIVALDRARDRLSARGALGLPSDRFVVAVFGGSLGARRINEATFTAVAGWRDRHDLAVRHVVGERDWPTTQARVAALGTAGPPGGRPSSGDDAAGALVYQAVRYEDRMDLLLAAADLAVCRAGATSVAELAVVGLASVLVPLPGAPGDHQTANAEALARAGGAIVIPDAQLDGPRLAEAVATLLGDPSRLAAMATAAREWSRPDAAVRVAEMVERHAGADAGAPARREGPGTTGS